MRIWNARVPEHVNPLSWALLGIRVLVSLIFLWHGVPKTLDWSATVDKFVGLGLPGFLGPTVGVVEVTAATLLFLGILHRWAAGALGVIITGALVTVQIPAGIQAGLERDLMILASIVVLLSAGPGALVVKWQADRRG